MDLQKFDAQKITETNSAWLNSADSFGMPTLDYEVILSWLVNHVNYDVQYKSLAYGVFIDGSDEAEAIVDVVYTKRPGPDVGWIKMLQVWFAPKYSPAELQKDNQKLELILDIYTEAIRGTILLTATHIARVIKLYGRDESLLSLLFALKERMSSTKHFQEALKAKMEGRWLVIYTE